MGSNVFTTDCSRLADYFYFPFFFHVNAGRFYNMPVLFPFTFGFCTLKNFFCTSSEKQAESLIFNLLIFFKIFDYNETNDGWTFHHSIKIRDSRSMPCQYASLVHDFIRLNFLVKCLERLTTWQDATGSNACQAQMTVVSRIPF